MPASPNVAPRSAVSSTGGAIITNGRIRLGVNPEGHLVVPGGPPSSGVGTTAVGVRFIPTEADGLSPGCPCEGWGILDSRTGVGGFANGDQGIQNLLLVSFTATSSEAISVVDVLPSGSGLRVTHYYHPSPVPDLYQIDVTVENLSSENAFPIYRRVMDWDIEPTAFQEWVSAGGRRIGDESLVYYNNNDGFATALPGPVRTSDLVTPVVTGQFADTGPMDHGALFEFAIADVAPGERLSFALYYGAAANADDAWTAISKVEGTDAYSLAKPDTPDGPTEGRPNTFIFALSFLPCSDPRSARDFQDYISLVRCVERLFPAYDTQTMLSLLRSLYYGNETWTKPGQKSTLFDIVIPCKPAIADPSEQLGLLRQALWDSQRIGTPGGGTDIGHLFVGLDAMTCPISGVSQPLFEQWATWAGDVGSAASLRSQDESQGVRKPIADYFGPEGPANPADINGDVDSYAMRNFLSRSSCSDAAGATILLSDLNLRSMSVHLSDYYLRPESPLGNERAQKFTCFVRAIGGQIGPNRKIKNKKEVARSVDAEVHAFTVLFHADKPGSNYLRANVTRAIKHFIDLLDEKLE